MNITKGHQWAGIKRWTGLGTAIFLLLWSLASVADDRIYSISKTGDFQAHYKAVYQSMENSRFFIIMEPNIGRNLSNFADRWGDDYNRNQFDEIRSMAFCNAWYANQVSNLEPDLLALCPLRISLTSKAGVTTVRFARPSVYASGTDAEKLLGELESEVIGAIEAVMK